MTTLSDYRLPRTVVPSTYDIHLEPDLVNARFDGRVRIEVDVREPTDAIVLNAVELVVSSAIVASDGVENEATIRHDDKLERVTLTTQAPVPAGPATIDLAFTGVLNDKLRGFYRSTFTDEDGASHVIATTQFESTNARRAFPCWDEPDFKATFGVTLVHDSDLMAISSGAETGSTVLDDGRTRTRFARTMSMSTYLLAFIVGPLEATEPTDVNGTPLRIVHPIGKGHLTDFALEVGAFSLRHFSEYFDIAYPGDKLDLVAVPDFAFGAMENLGCVTFREVLLLLDETATTQPEQQRAADVIAHEIAHMWFGDLVTMKWWNGIWLKEAFATFCEMHCTDAFRPDWNRWTDFGLSRTAAFDVDSLENTRPIEFEVVSPADAEAMYDVLTYEKGAAVVRMLEQYLGADRFRDGIRSYLRRHAYANTETHDLWDAIEDETGVPAREIMDSWIFQGGYPQISIRSSGDDTVEIRQKRFGYSANGPEGSWSVPIVLATGDARGGRSRMPVLLDSETTSATLETPTWILGNADGSGFYRCDHDGPLRERLLGSLDQLDAVERYGVLDDLWSSVVAGMTPPAEVLPAIEAMADAETNVSVWRRISGVLHGLDRHLTGPAHDAMVVWAKGLLVAGLARFDGSSGDRETRAHIFETLGILTDDATIDLARALVTAEDGGDPELFAAALRVTASAGTAEDHQLFVSRYESATTPQQERRYMFALTEFPGAQEMTATLGLVDAERVRSQDGAFVLGRSLGNHRNAEQVWDFIDSNWETLGRRYPDNAIPRMIQGVTSIGDGALADRITLFFDTHPVPQAGATLAQNLERMHVTVRLGAILRDAALF